VRISGQQSIGTGCSPLRWLCAFVAAATMLMGACSAQNPAQEPAPAGQMTPRAFIPSFGAQSNAAPAAGAAQTGQKRVLFIQGDHVPAAGTPSSRVRDDGKKPESFSRLRTEVLEGDLKLSVDEFVLTKNNAISPTQLAPYAVVVLGSNARVLTSDEVAALTAYYQNGGSILTYADSQFGPSNWDSDNSFLAQFGIEVLTDNLQPAVDIKDFAPAHPIMTGIKDIRAEGISQFRVAASTLNQNQDIAWCRPLNRKGCTLPTADLAKVQKGDDVACVVVREDPKGGRLAGVCDRNIFQNGPGPGSDLNQANNRLFARNLFRWLSKL
jgi:hypothetical protein